MSDTPIEQFFPLFANTGVPVAFLVPTPTGYGKSIMDATGPVRELFKNAKLHDYEVQGQGPEHKVMIKSYFVYPDRTQETAASLYRPVTKKGDPRIWFKDLKSYCMPCNLLALITIEDCIYVINLSNPMVAASLWNKGYVYDILLEAAHKDRLIADELLQKIQAIHNQGFLPSITPGDPGVGDTLEHALGIERNNSRAPDYKGIELKTTRLTRNGVSRQVTRSTLFTKVPDVGMTYREIVDHYGKIQIPRGSTVARLQLYETFWVKAVSENRDGQEWFRYDKILHTKNPNTSLLAPLLEADKITVDLAAHYNPDGKWRDHGMLFKMLPIDLPLLLGDPIEYDLTHP